MKCRMPPVVYYIVVLTLAALAGGQVRHAIMLVYTFQCLIKTHIPPTHSFSRLNSCNFVRMTGSFEQTYLKYIYMDSNLNTLSPGL